MGTDSGTVQMDLCSVLWAQNACYQVKARTSNEPETKSGRTKSSVERYVRAPLNVLPASSSCFLPNWCHCAVCGAPPVVGGARLSRRQVAGSRLHLATPWLGTRPVVCLKARQLPGLRARQVGSRSVGQAQSKRRLQQCFQLLFDGVGRCVGRPFILLLILQFAISVWVAGCFCSDFCMLLCCEVGVRFAGSMGIRELHVLDPPR